MPMRVHRPASKAYPVPASPPPCTTSAGVARQHSKADDMPWQRGEGSAPGWPSRPFLPSLPSFPGAPSLPVAPASKKSETLRPAIRAKPSHKRNRKTRQPKARTFLARSAVLARRADGASLAISTRSAVLARSTVHTIHTMNARCTIQAVFPRRAVSTCASNRGKCEAPQSEDAQSRLCVAPKAGIVHTGTIMCERAWRSMRDRQGKLTVLARLALSAGLARRTCISDRNELTPDERALGIYSPSPS